MKMVLLNKAGSKSESLYILFMALMWALHPILSDIVVLGGKFIGDSLALWLTAGAMILLGLCSMSYWSRYLRPKEFVVYAVICLIFVLEFTFIQENSAVLEPLAIPFLFLVVPYVFLGAAFDINKLEREIYLISFVSVLVQAFFYLIFLRNLYSGNNLAGDQIVPAYQTLPHVLVILWQMLKKANVYNISAFVLGMFILLSLGNRGSILSVVFFMVVYLLFIGQKAIKSQYKFLLVALFALFIAFFNPIMDFVARQTESLGMSMSFFNKLADDITDSNGRDVLYGLVWENIKTGPLFGYGLGGDRNLVGIYSHNFILELMVSFGSVLGAIISLCLVWYIAKTFFITKDSSQRAFLLVLLGPSMIKLFFSSSFLTEPYMFLLIGYCMSLRTPGLFMRQDQ